MTIQTGDTIPSVNLATKTTDGPSGVSTDDIFKDKKVILFGLPGAFTPTCSAQHLPGYIKLADKFKAKGIDTIACLSVNDPFVMGAWGKDQKVGDEVLLLADGSAEFTKAAGLEFDLSAKGLGLRCQRFAMIVNDGKVEKTAIEDAGAFEVSSAEAMLSAL